MVAFRARKLNWGLNIQLMLEVEGTHVANIRWQN